MEFKSSKIKWLIPLLIGCLVAVSGWWYSQGGNKLLNPGAVHRVVELPYAKLSFTRLAERERVIGTIEVGRLVAETPEYTSYIFYYYSGGKKISGQLNMPAMTAGNKTPVIVMARGYVAKEDYKTGVGTKNAAAVYASHGYITIAPDFLGYGESEMEDTDSMGARLYRPVEILDLLSSLSSLPQADTGHVYLWGHSNGGQIMLSVAEILGKSSLQGSSLKVRGMVLWAPVSKPFPFNLLAFSDEADDQGKLLRKVVSDFETNYDVFDYSIDRYWDWINVPIQLHQGTADPEVAKVWSDDLVKTLKAKGKDITYYLYPGADHNLRPGWDMVVTRDVAWFDKLK